MCSPLARAAAVQPDSIPFTHVVIDSFAPRHPEAKAAGDVTGDGYPDIVVASGEYKEGVVLYVYPTWQQFYIIEPGLFNYTSNMQMADIDDDGDLDVVVPKGTSIGTTIWWLENPLPLLDPTGGSWIEHFVGTAYAHDIRVCDINQDGKLDIIGRFYDTVLFVQQSPTSWMPDTLSVRAWEGLDVGDIDGDGDTDIAINSYWLENPLPALDPLLDPWPEHYINGYWPAGVAVHLADINADQRLDVIYSYHDRPDGRLAWYAGPVDPKNDVWDEYVIDPDIDYYHGISTADMDLDGDLDIVTAEMHVSTDPDDVCVYRNLGDGLAWSQQVVDTTGSHNTVVVDIGLDGDFDIVGANWDGSVPLNLWVNNMAESLATAVVGPPPFVRWSGNYPNPFASSTTITFDLPEAGPASVTIYDVTGRLVTTITDRVFAAGPARVVWNGRDPRGRRLPSGVYLYAVRTPASTRSGKMLLVR